uniref:Uncharacterized protein n=1 Tax=Solanum lycopersicum TaxID=4081 RepID=A0A3Q7HJF7_SOLLC
MPVLAFPQWGDQITDAKYLIDVFKIGLRLCRGVAENRIIPREEVEICVREATIGPKTLELKENTLKWKKRRRKQWRRVAPPRGTCKLLWAMLDVCDSNSRMEPPYN